MSTIDQGFRRPPIDRPVVCYIPPGLTQIDLVEQSELVLVDDLFDEYDREPMPRSRVGISLGRGLFCDLYGNLSFVPFLAFFAPLEMALGDNVSLDYDPPGLCDDITLEQNENAAKVKRWLPWRGTSIEFGESAIRVDNPGRENDFRLELRGDGYRMEPRRHDGISFRVRLDDDRVKVRSKDGNSTIYYEQDEITVDPPGWFNRSQIACREGRLEEDHGLWSSSSTLVEPDRIENGGGCWPPTVIRLDADANEISIDPPGWFNKTTIRGR